MNKQKLVYDSVLADVNTVQTGEIRGSKEVSRQRALQKREERKAQTRDHKTSRFLKSSLSLNDRSGLPTAKEAEMGCQYGQIQQRNPIRGESVAFVQI